MYKQMSQNMGVYSPIHITDNREVIGKLHWKSHVQVQYYIKPTSSTPEEFLLQIQGLPRTSYVLKDFPGLENNLEKPKTGKNPMFKTIQWYATNIESMTTEWWGYYHGKSFKNSNEQSQ